MPNEILHKTTMSMRALGMHHNPDPHGNPPKEFVVSYMRLRQSIGWIGFLMPVCVRLLAYVTQNVHWTDSISAYYYTAARDELVGPLVLVGVQLCSYRTPAKQDNILALVAGISGICVALFPMSQQKACGLLGSLPACQPPPGQGPVVHMYFAIVFFVVISYMVLFRFKKTWSGTLMKRKIIRNRVYMTMGSTMAASFVLIGYFDLTGNETSIFWPETMGVMAFAAAWRVKGQVILRG